MIKYYEENGETFFKNTIKVDMSNIYIKFEKHLKDGNNILDLGCGSGRDTEYFLKRGYKVLPTDYSDEMVRIATKQLGKKVIKEDMRKMNYKNQFHGIWACASILHIKKDEIPEVLKRCYQALKKDGILYMSFKYGHREISVDGRHFSNFTQSSIIEMIKRLNIFEIKEIFQTKDIREKNNTLWINIILKRK